MAKKDDADDFEKLMKLTKLMKKERVKVAPKGPSKANNKWKSQDPKFTPKPEQSSQVVEAGGMKVDPSLKDEYEKWRQDKMEEQKVRREQAQRKAASEKRARESMEKMDY